jgi:hypothetical protein
MGWGSGIREKPIPDQESTEFRIPATLELLHTCDFHLVWRVVKVQTTIVDFRFHCRSSAESRQAASQTILSRVSSPLSWLQVCNIYLILFLVGSFHLLLGPVHFLFLSYSGPGSFVFEEMPTKTSQIGF